MDIRLTKQELALLLRLSCMGEWIKHGRLEDEKLDDAGVQAHKLVLRKLLAGRDLVSAVGELAYQEMPAHERIAKITQLSEWYLNEWATHGIQRLKLDAKPAVDAARTLN
ncbi:MAG: hypothetical protein R8K50_04085 [Mariprofundus sp.]